MSEALLLPAARVTGQSSAVSQTVCFGTAGKWIYEHQKQPAPVEKAAYRKMPKVAPLLDAQHVFLPRKNSVINYPKGSITLYQLVDDNCPVKVPGACTGNRGAAFARVRFVTGRFLDLSAYWLQSPHKKAPAHHTK